MHDKARRKKEKNVNNKLRIVLVFRFETNFSEWNKLSLIEAAFGYIILYHKLKIVEKMGDNMTRVGTPQISN